MQTVVGDRRRRVGCAHTLGLVTAVAASEAIVAVGDAEAKCVLLDKRRRRRQRQR